MNITREEVQQVLDALHTLDRDESWYLARNLLQSKLENADGEPAIKEVVVHADYRQMWLDHLHLCQQLTEALAAAQSTHPAPKPMTDFDIRGTLSTLKCWHRLTGDEVQDLIEFAQKQQQK